MSEATEISLDDEIKLAFLEESAESLEPLCGYLINLEKDPLNKELINSIFRPVHSLKGNSSFFGFHRLRAFAHELESLLACMREGKCSLCPKLYDTLLRGIEELILIVARLSSGGVEVADEEKYNSLFALFTEMRTGAGQSIEVAAADRDKLIASVTERAPDLLPLLMSALSLNREDAAILTENRSPVLPEPKSVTVEEHVSNAKSLPSEKRHEMRKMMRVREEDVDNFLSSVGELLELGEAISYLNENLSDSSSAGSNRIAGELKRISQDYSKITGSLQKSVMGIRKISVKPLFAKLPKIARDVAQSRNKEIELTIRGDDLFIDKSLVEILDAPLLHIVRNAVDHGIELPNDRVASGKPPVGQVVIELSETERNFLLTIEDDGGGIRLDALSRKAIEQGLIKEGEVLSQSDIVSLIFAAGVSTAEVVTDVSGRGVGMDVVRRGIEDAGGVITVDTATGKGSLFKLELPKSVSTQIMMGLVTQVGGRQFIFSADKVKETFPCYPSDILLAMNGGNCLYRYGEHLPILNISKIFGERSEADGVGVAITAKIRGVSVVIVVDQVINVLNVVVKKLADIPIFDPMFLGAAITGDGSLALVVDLEKLLDSFLAEDRFLSSITGNLNPTSLVCTEESILQ
jgi:two-component system chemotaxis sensor kinase CheA